MIKKKTVTFSAIILLSPFLISQNKSVSFSESLPIDTVKAGLQRLLTDELTKYYPLVLDTVDGGYLSDVDYRWELNGIQNKMIVTQSRHIWSTSNAVHYFKNDPALLKTAKHGVQFLEDKMWDRDYGGFYDLVDRQGKPLGDEHGNMKTAYGNAFAIYGLAAYYRASGDTAALTLAIETFSWLEKHSYDEVNGGYFQNLQRNGTPFKNNYRTIPPKDQNSTIHLLEALTELYDVWPDAILKKRLASLLHIVRDVITTKKGYMVLFFQQNWTPVSYRDSSAGVREKNYEYDHVSFGHDVETAYLMLEASKALGLQHDTVTLAIGKKMVDHALKNGWDTTHGGIYDGGYYFTFDGHCSILHQTKEWWAQAEAMNSLLLMAQLFPDDTMQYYEKFLRQYAYIEKYLIDHEYGGWYWGGTDIVPALKKSPKASIWKANYHTSRALMNCINRLHSPSSAN
ncbi:MAG TPA: AGE family epimerase/isomerase [Bacteroidota bacterium]|nr:AGE family epimerase/isomerase [Bacteroidota bacterium]